MPPRHDGFEGGGGVPDPGDPTFVKRTLAVMVGAVVMGYVLAPDIIHLAAGTLGSP